MTYNPLVKIKELTGSSSDGKPNQHQPFFCVPGSGGVSLCLYNLATQLSRRGYPVFGFDAPGIMPGTQTARTVEEHAKLYTAALMRSTKSSSYNLGGYCFGALIVFEMARLLAAGGYRIRLVLIDPPVPATAEKNGLSRLPNPAKTTGNVTADSTIPADYQRLIQAASTAAANYRAKPVAVEALFVTRFDHLLAFDTWYYLTGGRLTEQAMPCEHLQILKEPHVTTLADWIDEFLADSD